MSEPYEEIVRGESLLRSAPTPAHELLVNRLHAWVGSCLSPNSSLKALHPRTGVDLGEAGQLQPDLCIIRRPPGAPDEEGILYLVAEVLLPGDHHADTVMKKQVWADLRLPRLWMVDPRYLNVEVYASTEFGFTLLDILANRHPLTDPNLPGLSRSMTELFAGV